MWSEARAEKRVAERLISSGFEVWLPTVASRRRWSDRWKTVTVPLFPGYLFATTRGAGYAPLLRTLGVLTLVKDGMKPAALSSDYVRDLRRLVDHPGLNAEPVSGGEDFEIGEEVLVREGPLAGHRGHIVELRGTRKIVLWISGIGRGLLCTLGDAAVIRCTAAA